MNNKLKVLVKIHRIFYKLFEITGFRIFWGINRWAEKSMSKWFWEDRKRVIK
jgi:hypothetical protein